MEAPDPDRPATRRSLRIPIACAAAAVLLAGAFHLHTGFVNDDALITARYAEHLAHGQGLVYNVGERTLGTTTPLWALVLAGFAAAGVPTVAAACWLGVLCHGAAAGLTAALLGRRGAGALACLAGGLAVAACPVLVEWAGSGMEAPAAEALVALFLLLYEMRRAGAMGVVGGLMVLTRPDLGLVIAAAAVLDVVRTRSVPTAGEARQPRGEDAARVPWRWRRIFAWRADSAESQLSVLRAVPGFAVVVLPWVAVAAWYYGSPLPNSGFAKRLQVEDWGPYAAHLGAALWDAGPLLPLALVGAAVGLSAASPPHPRAAGTSSRDRDDSHAPSSPSAGGLRPHWAERALPALALVATAVGMHLGGLPGCGWYMVPPLLLTAVLAAAGAAEIAERLAAASAPRAVVLAVLAGPLLVALPLRTAAHEWKITQFQTENCHGRVGTWLAGHAPEGASVAVDNIGYIGYRSGLRVIDMLGLVQPETAAAIARGERDFALVHHRPELAAFWSGRGKTWKYLPPPEWFEREGYRKVFEAPLYDNLPLPAYVVWSRVPLRGE